MILVVSVPSRSPRLISAIVSSSPSRYLWVQLVVHLGDGLDHRVAVLVGLGPELGRDVDDVDLVAEVVAVVDRLHLDQVDRRRGSWSSLPIGIWIGTAFAPRRSLMLSTPRQKSAPVRSSLLMKQKRGTP